MILYAGTIFLGAFLLFLVQPTMAKQILSWSGGSAAVWATDQILVTHNRELLQHEKIRGAARPIAQRPGFRTWTDDCNNPLTVLK